MRGIKTGGRKVKTRTRSTQDLRFRGLEDGPVDGAELAGAGLTGSMVVVGGVEGAVTDCAGTAGALAVVTTAGGGGFGKSDISINRAPVLESRSNWLACRMKSIPRSVSLQLTFDSSEIGPITFCPSYSTVPSATRVSDELPSARV